MLFNKLGRIVPTAKCRVFAKAERDFYRLNAPTVDYDMQHSKALKLGIVNCKSSLHEIESEFSKLLKGLKDNENYRNLTNGTYIPFVMSLPDLPDDIGAQLENYLLPLLQKNFENEKTKSWFKAVLQGNNKLVSSLHVFPQTGYDVFIEGVSTGTVVGLYFPTALQEYDIASQRSQLTRLSGINGYEFCISGHLEIIYSLLTYPNLLNNPTSYSPILCASALEHDDQRMVPVFKSYGPHCEFWLLSQMMTTTQTQVSEQWSGGLTLFKKI